MLKPGHAESHSSFKKKKQQTVETRRWALSVELA